MVKYDIVIDSISDTEVMYDVILWNQQEAEWVLVRSCDTRCEALEYINEMLMAILRMRESELRETRAKVNMA